MGYNIVIHKNNGPFGCLFNTPEIDWKWIDTYFNKYVKKMVKIYGYTVSESSEITEDMVDHFPYIQHTYLYNPVKKEIIHLEVKIEENI